jgi:hypothetical protein
MPGNLVFRLASLSTVLIATLSLSPTAAAQTWVHPGIAVSRAQLDATRAAYRAGNPVIVDQVNKAVNSTYGSLTYTVQGPWPGGVNQCGSNSTPNNGCLEADNDSNAAYVQALLWYMTGNQTYANNAISIMNTYARNFKGYAGTNGLPCPSHTDCSNGPLQSGWDSEKWPRAAEIIRYGRFACRADDEDRRHEDHRKDDHHEDGEEREEHHHPGAVCGGSGWADSDIAAFATLLSTIYQPVIQNGSGVNGNWDMTMIDGTMQIAVFTENAALLENARTLWKGRVPDLFYLSAVDGSTHAPSPRGNVFWFGQVIFDANTNNVGQETCRDLRHMEDSIASTILTAETDWIQGGELYTDTTMQAQERIVGSMNVMAGLESQRIGGPDTLIPAPSEYCTAAAHLNQISIGPGTTYAIGYNAYHNRLNVAAMADGSGTSGLHGTANTYNWIQNGLLTQSLSNDQGNHMTLFEALTHTVEVCRRSTREWTNTAFTAQTGSPDVKFSATPSANDINAVVGLSDGPQWRSTGLAAIVRFNPSGFIDAYDGTGYSALTSIPYTGGTRYSFWLRLNVPAQTYDVYVTPEGGQMVQIGANFAFRRSVPALNNVTWHAERGSDDICSFNLPLGGN